MKRGTKLLLLLGALVLCVGGYLLVSKQNQESAAEESDTDTSVTLLYADPANVTKLQWTYEGESFSLSLQDSGWVCDNDTSLPVDQDQVTTMLSAVSNISATSTLENPEDLSQYNLTEADGIRVTVSTADSEQSILIGSYNDYADSCYATMDGSTVCLVGNALRDTFAIGLNDLVLKETLPDLSNLTYVDVSLPDRELVLRHAVEGDDLYEEDGSNWYLMQESGYLTLDADAVDTLTGKLTGLTFQNVAAYNVTDFTSYGDTAKVHLLYTDADGAAQSLTICLGDEGTDGVYAWIDGSTIVYHVAANVLTALQGATADTLTAAE